MDAVDLPLVRKRAFTATWHAIAALISPALMTVIIWAHVSGLIVIGGGLGVFLVFLGVFGLASFVAFIFYLALAFLAQRSVLWVLWVVLVVVFPLVGGAIALFVLWMGVGRLEATHPIAAQTAQI